MSARALKALIRKDLLVFRSDRRAVIISFVLPIALASFMGFLFGGNRRADSSKIEVRLAVEDDGPLAAAAVERLTHDPALAVVRSDAAAARDAVRRGKVAVAVVMPKGFGAALASGARPELELAYDPSHVAERAMVEGIVIRQVLRARMGDVDEQRQLPFLVKPVEMTNGEARYNGYAHSFAGMGVQFVLMSALEAGLVLITQRQRGVWKRLRAAPLSRHLLLASRAISGAIIALAMMLALFGFASVVFGVSVNGSLAGFLGVCVATALMAASFGLLVAALGKTPEATRGIGIFVTLVLVMVGGAWVPTFLFPGWMQRLAVISPARWAVDGLDAMLWRGLPIEAALAPIAALVGFALLFGVLAWSRFRWEAGNS